MPPSTINPPSSSTATANHAPSSATNQNPDHQAPSMIKQRIKTIKTPKIIKTFKNHQKPRSRTWIFKVSLFRNPRDYNKWEKEKTQSCIVSVNFVEISVQSESTTENNSVKEKRQERNCKTEETGQNDRVYEKKKKGRLKGNGVVVIKWLHVC